MEGSASTPCAEAVHAAVSAYVEVIIGIFVQASSHIRIRSHVNRSSVRKSQIGVIRQYNLPCILRSIRQPAQFSRSEGKILCFQVSRFATCHFRNTEVVDSRSRIATSACIVLPCKDNHEVTCRNSDLFRCQRLPAVLHVQQ